VTLDEVIAAIEALPVHEISGYEWECDECHWDFKRADGETNVDSQGNPCDHRDLLDRKLVLAILKDARKAVASRV
jgi:hypothetical protein